ncbi:acetoin utilization protein AcuC [Sanguibacter antarcticus]|uniref:Acetoin utilization protein AcuC n=1 Tax=Sanguibacter antarcticus TaxID=372484 RepID=A0A2A9E7F7_9MICO|nr:acetoin utilization protein AcuC [Sanguibacter antarcticus]PFG34149.1 acetoin utilization protein AcuC [Sanguibacter antarcticus]
MPFRVRISWSPELVEHNFGRGHPMAPLRLDLTVRLAEGLGLLAHDDVTVVGSSVASDELLSTVHEPEYVAAVHAASDDDREDPARGLGTDDNPIFPGIHESAARIVSGTVESALAVWRGEATHAVNLAGGMHHARVGGASGFCIYNDIAIAIRALLDAGVERVAYVDVDAHHGDGVEAAFWDDPRVLTVSVHQSGASLFPGTGHATDTGGPHAQGSAVNVALPAKTRSAEWLRAVDAVVPDAVRAFEPQVIVSQHGCDAHGKDTLSDLDVAVDAQRQAAEWVHDLAHEVADGRWVALGGGGYAVLDVVPIVWCHVLAIAEHRPVGPMDPVPAAWRAYVEEMLEHCPPEVMSDDEGAVAFVPWSSGFDPDQEVDRAVRATRQAAFPLLGVDVSRDV